MNTKFLIGLLVFVLSLLSPLGFAAGVGPSELPPKEKEEADDDNQLGREPQFSIHIPEEALEIPGFFHFINLVERGRVDEVRDLLEEVPELTHQYVSIQLLFVTPDSVNPPNIGQNPRGPALTLAALMGNEAMLRLLANFQDGLEEEAPLYTAVHANLPESVRAILEIARRNPYLRTNLLGETGYPEVRRSVFECVIGLFGGIIKFALPNLDRRIDRVRKASCPHLQNNAFEYAVRLDRPEIVALMLDFAKTHPEFAEWFFPERSHSAASGEPAVNRAYAQRMGRNLFVAATQFRFAVVDVLLRSSFADRFYVDAEKIAEKFLREAKTVMRWYGLCSPRGIDFTAKYLVMERLITDHRPDYAELAHEFPIPHLDLEYAFLNRDIQLLGGLLDIGHDPFRDIIRRTLTLLLEKLYSEDALRKMFEPFAAFLNQMIELRKEAQSWQYEVQRLRLEDLISILTQWMEDSRFRTIHALGRNGGAVLQTLILRETGQPWKRRR